MRIPVKGESSSTETITPAAETPARPAWQTERLKAIKGQTAAAKSDLSPYQIEALEAWYAGFFGEWPDESVSSDALAKLFLDPPAQWPLSWRQPTTINVEELVEMTARDGSIHMVPTKTSRTFEPKTEEDVNRILAAKFGSEPGLTVQVLKYSFRHGNTLALRGELLFLTGVTIKCQRVDLEKDVFYRVVAEQLDARPLSSVGACPMPMDTTTPGDSVFTVVPGPDGARRIEIGTKGRKRLPRTVGSLISEYSRETHELVPGYVEKTAPDGTVYLGMGDVWRPRRDLVAVGV